MHTARVKVERLPPPCPCVLLVYILHGNKGDTGFGTGLAIAKSVPSNNGKKACKMTPCHAADITARVARLLPAHTERSGGIKRGTASKHCAKGIPWSRVSPVPGSVYQIFENLSNTRF